MRAVVQRAKAARVTVGEKTVGEIDKGLVVFLGVAQGDRPEEAKAIAQKILSLRVFDDLEGKMNLALKEAGGSVLLVPQFTVMGDVRKGNRPSFHQAAGKAEGENLFTYVGLVLEAEGAVVATGAFGEHMMVSVENDGPVTILVDTQRTF